MSSLIELPGRGAETDKKKKYEEKLASKYIRVINQKKEICVLNRFMLEWELSVNIPESMDRLEDVYLKVHFYFLS